MGEKIDISNKKLFSTLSNLLMKETEIAFKRREKINRKEKTIEKSFPHLKKVRIDTKSGVGERQPTCKTPKEETAKRQQRKQVNE